MDYLATRMQSIDASGIRKAFALAAKLKDPINLSIGQPDYDVDEAVKQVAIESIQRGRNQYTQTWGIDELRTAIADYYAARFGHRLENVMVTAGVSGALMLSLMATVNPGDEVLFAEPYFVMYPHLTRLFGGVPRPIPCYPDFKLRPEALEAAITERSKVLIVNSPANPTGVALTSEEMDAIARVAKKHNLLVISDEIYESLIYDGAPASMAGRCENLIVLNGFSKNAGMTGWRLGYAAGPEPIIQAMNTLQQYSFVCAPSFAQYAGIAALKADMTEKCTIYRKKRDLVYEGLCGAFECTRPDGAFYIFPKVPAGTTATEFVKRAIDANVIIIPGNVFSAQDTHFRISFATTDDMLQRGVDALCELAAATV